MILHPDRYSTSNVAKRKLGIVVHDAESPDDATDSLIRLLAQPGDRWLDTSDHSKGVYGSGYHAVTRLDSHYTAIAPFWVGPYAAPPLNKTWAHVCMPGFARQTVEEWSDPLSRAHIIGCARFIVDVATEFDLPIGFVDAHGLLAGDSGYTSHWEVSKAWGNTDHTDPGSNFPWQLLAAQIRALQLTTPAPPPPANQEDRMKIQIMQPIDSNAVFLGECDPVSLVSLNIRWSGPGSAKVDAMIQAHINAGAIDRRTNNRPSIADLGNCFLDGPLPYDDTVAWTKAMFAGVDQGVA